MVFPGVMGRRVKSEVVTLQVSHQGATVIRDGATRERLRHGDVRTAVLRDEWGHAVEVQRSLSMTERLASLGQLGDDIAPLIEAAEWFCGLADSAKLRGRLVQSQLAQASTAIEPGELLAARIMLARIYDGLGQDAFSVLYDALVWSIEPRGPERRRLYRMALFSLSQWRKTKSPPDRKGPGG